MLLLDKNESQHTQVCSHCLTVHCPVSLNDTELQVERDAIASRAPTNATQCSVFRSILLSQLWSSCD